MSTPTTDSFANFQARLGLGANNQFSGGGYTLNPITRLRIQLEYAYRSNWVVRNAINAIPSDMTREGIIYKGTITPEEISLLNRAATQLGKMQSFCSGLQWARLYGGSIVVMMIDGQDYKSPLRIDTIGRGQYKGLVALDRWMLTPTLNELVDDEGADIGMPKYYRVVPGVPTLAGQTIHYSRCVRLSGEVLPYWQSQAENLWGLSVLEPIWDRLIAYDSATLGAAQLVFKAHLRTYSIAGLRNLIAGGGKSLEAVVKNVEMIRLNQSIEGLSLIDTADTLEAATYSFAGLSDVLMQFAEQISGALETPLVKVFGQSPSGFSTGETDLTNYYDTCHTKQEFQLRNGMHKVNRVEYASVIGKMPPDDFDFDFAPLWQLKPADRAAVASAVTTTVMGAHESGLISAATGLRELKQSSDVTGIWSNITDEDISSADQDPPSGETAIDPEDGLLPKGGSTGREEAVDDPLAKQDPKGQQAAKETVPTDKVKDGRSVKGKRTHDRLLPMLEFQGIPIIIENFKGTRRPGGTWVALLGADYGYFQRTEGSDGDQVDVFVGEDLASPQVFLIDQVVKATGAHDAFKVMVGFDNMQNAAMAYSTSYDDAAPTEIGSMSKLTVDGLRAWLAKHQLPTLRAVK
jgi:phage-related protein (TIGR01555 family)